MEIHTKEQSITWHHAGYSIAQGKSGMLWHYQVNGACPANGMSDVSDDDFGLVAGLLGF